MLGFRLRIATPLLVGKRLGLGQIAALLLGVEEGGLLSCRKGVLVSARLRGLRQAHKQGRRQWALPFVL